jgi:Na+/H+ antiporter NhaD/arsenite permease-like protein
MSTQPSPLWNKFTNCVRRDLVLSITTALAAVLSLFKLPSAADLDFKVLITLFNLMIVLKALEHLSLLDTIAIRLLRQLGSERRVALGLVTLSFFSAMLITNDVALLTLVPIALIIGHRGHYCVVRTIVLATLAANIGSSLTPMGNPQNLYILTRDNLSAASFFSVVAPFSALGGLWLIWLSSRLPVRRLSLDLDSPNHPHPLQLLPWLALFSLIILSVFNLISDRLTLGVVLAATLLLRPKLLIAIDYGLLATFIGFFIIVARLSEIPAVISLMSALLASPVSVYLSSLLFSQLISNVPGAILLSGFTESWRPLLLGVNVGGMGTLIASLASVISYRIFLKDHPGEAKAYLKSFIMYNAAGLLLFGGLGAVFVWLL